MSCRVVGGHSEENAFLPATSTGTSFRSSRPALSKDLVDQPAIAKRSLCHRDRFKVYAMTHTQSHHFRRALECFMCPHLNPSLNEGFAFMPVLPDDRKSVGKELPNRNSDICNSPCRRINSLSLAYTLSPARLGDVVSRTTMAVATVL